MHTRYCRRRPQGVGHLRPTGPNGTFTRKDHLRGAGLAAVVAVGLLALASLVALLAQAFNDGHLDGVYAGVVVACTLGFFLALAACGVSLLRAAVG